MPKPINPDVGACPCPMPGCTETAAVRRFKGHERGRLYLHCPSCHTIRTTGAQLQEYIEGHATMNEAGQVPAPTPAPKPTPAPPAQVQAPERTPAPEKPAKVPGPPPAPVSKQTQARSADAELSDWWNE